MTEAEWLACRKPKALLRVVSRKWTSRKEQHFLPGVGRLLWEHLTDLMRQMFVLHERLADGEVDYTAYCEQLARVMDLVGRSSHRQGTDGSFEAAVMLMIEAAASYDPANGRRATLEWGEQAYVLAAPECLRPQARHEFQAHICDLLRELFPPPDSTYVVQPDFVGGGLLLPDGSTFHVPEVAHILAAGVQRDQAFDRLPILADALEDAGCPDRPLLDHLRHGTNHRRGCWALDLLLGRG